MNRTPIVSTGHHRHAAGVTGTTELVHAVLDAAAAVTPDAVAVGDRDGHWTYRELVERSYAVAAWLAASGVGHRDRVVAQLPSTRELVALLYGVSRRGAVFVSANTGMKDYHLRSVVEDTDPKLLLVADDAVGRVAEFSSGPVVGLGPFRGEVDARRAEGTRAPDVAVDPEDVAALVYTSGSTARPKGVICPHGRMLFAARAIQAELGYRPDDVVFCRFPISWDYGLYKVLLAALGRSTIELADGDSDLVLLRRIRETGATVVPLVPTLATMICRLAERDPEHQASGSRVRMLSNTGAHLPATTADALRSAFPGAVIVRQFGQTECKRITVLPADVAESKPDSVGRPLPGTRVAVLGEDGAELATGQVGEIVVDGPHVMPGYWRAPELTDRTFRRDPATGRRRLHTGDYGRLDEDGYLYYEGRRDDMFKRKGVRMSTVEIETAAMDVPGVRAAAALPPDGDHDLTLFVEGDVESHAVLRGVAERLEPAKVPGRCEVLGAIPLTPHGKNERRQLAALAGRTA